jgi:hypothetical protein
MISTNISVWISAFLTFCVWSYFSRNKQNLAFRFAQSTIIGTGLGYVIVLVMLKNVDRLAMTKIVNGQWIYVLPVILGLMMYTKFIPRYSYLARIPIAVIVAVGLGIGARASLETDVILQVLASANTPVVGVDLYTALNGILLTLGVVTSILYFFFMVNDKWSPKLAPFLKIGRYFIMAYLGTSFGSAILTRVTLFISRALYIVFDFLGL